MKEAWNNIWLGGSFIVLSLLLYFVLIPVEVADMGSVGLRPSFFPSMASILILVSSLCLVIVSIRTIRKNGALHHWQIALVERRDIKVVLIMLLLVLFIVLFKYSNFLIASTITLIGLIRYFGEKRYLLNISVSLCSSIVTYFFFEKVLKVVLH